MTTKATEPAKGDAKAEKTALSPEALLKAVVTGGKVEAPVLAARRRPDPLLMAVGGGALALGLICGAGLTASLSRPERADMLAEVHSGIDAARAETARVATEVERLARAMAAVQDVAEAGRKETATRAASLSERVGKAEQGLSAKVAALSEKIEQAERDAAARVTALAGQIEKQRAAAAMPAAAPMAAKLEPAKSDPVQTGSIEPRKGPEKPPVVESWAVRDVFDGVAILEDRRRRLVEVGPGGAVPGVGRVEAIERRGREWVVVTRQGLITPQAW